MPDQNHPVLIYSTYPSPAQAKRIGEALLRQRLAACVNIFSSMTAIFEWQGELQEAEEAVMLVKTRTGLQAAAIEEIERLHPYDTPAVLVLAVSGSSSGFIDWIADQTQHQKTASSD